MVLMPQVERIPFNGRDVYLVTGHISQTVNVCTKDNRRGDYEWTVRINSDHFLKGDDIRSRTDTHDLIDWLTHEKFGHIELSPSGINIDYGTGEESEDSIWIERAIRIVEVCIDALIREFLDLPYLHRVEHSIHTRLYSILRNQPHFDRHFPLLESGMQTQPIHKEWPETIPRPGKDNRRGNFDLAILSPEQLKTCTLVKFSNGQLAPAIVIEMGLNYKEGHLLNDAKKLLNSQVHHGYLIHLVREKPDETTINETIRQLRKHDTIKVAYARVERGRKFIKLLADPAIYEIR